MDFLSLAHLAAGGVWRVASVSQQPSLTLVRWKIFQLANGERHFCGWAVQNREGRASTAIQTFDACELKGQTSSGRVYQLYGPPGEDAEGLHVWCTWARINCAENWTDVSEEVWVQHEGAEHDGGAGDASQNT
jgi:hypothetical protein